MKPTKPSDKTWLKPKRLRINITPKNLLVLFLFVLLFSSVAYAENYTCLDNMTSQLNITGYNSSGILSQIYVENESCAFGCSNFTGQCVDSDIGFGGISIVLVVSFLAFLFMFSATREELSFTLPMGKFAIDPMKLLFIGLSLWMIIIDFSIIMDYAKASSHVGISGILSPGWNGIIWAFVLIAFVLVLTFMYIIIKMLSRFAMKRR